MTQFSSSNISQTNPPSRPLVKLREVLAGTPQYAVEAAASDMLVWLIEQRENYFMKWTDPEMDHATKVLTRLAEAEEEILYAEG